MKVNQDDMQSQVFIHDLNVSTCKGLGGTEEKAGRDSLNPSQDVTRLQIFKIVETKKEERGGFMKVNPELEVFHRGRGQRERR